MNADQKADGARCQGGSTGLADGPLLLDRDFVHESE
jgi:hypothetical protein